MAPRPRTRQAISRENDAANGAANLITPTADHPEKAPKRKRGQTTTERPAAKRAVVSTDDAESNAVTGTSPPSQSDNPSIGAATHPYGTRPTNDLHPGKHAGIEKRRQADISMEAAAKKAERQVEVDAKLREREEKAQHEREGVRAIATLLDRRRAEEISGEFTSELNKISGLPEVVKSIPKATVSTRDVSLLWRHPTICLLTVFFFSGTCDCEGKKRSAHSPAMV